MSGSGSSATSRFTPFRSSKRKVRLALPAASASNPANSILFLESRVLASVSERGLSEPEGGGPGASSAAQRVWMSDSRQEVSLAEALRYFLESIRDNALVCELSKPGLQAK